MKKILLLLTVIGTNGILNAQWVSQSTGFSVDAIGIKDIHVFDENNVWATAFDGNDSSTPFLEFAKTTNGGASWTTGIIDNGQPEWTVDNLCAVSMNTAWIACTDLVNSPANGGIWKTTDGGITWNRQLESAFLDPSSYLNVVLFANENVGVAEGDPLDTDLELYRTTDGGASWDPIPSSATPDVLAGEFGYNGGNVVIGNSMWFVTNKGKIYHTADAGVTWTKKNTPISDFAGTAVGGEIFFKDTNVGCLIARSTVGTTSTFKIHTTTNAGTTWSAGVACPYNSIAYVPGTNIMVGTRIGSGYSTDNGATWTPIDTTIQKYEPKFINATTGFAGGFTNAGAGGVFKFAGTLANETFSNDKAFTASPNPTSGLVTIAGKGISNVVITDVLGKQVANTNFTSVESATIDMSSYNAGVYLVKVTNANGNASTIKVVRQ